MPNYYIESDTIKKNPSLYQAIDTSVSWIHKEKFVYDWVDKLPRHSKILDLGCGNGYWLSWLKDKGFKDLVGVDIANYLHDKSIPHSVVDINVEKLPFPNTSFDLVTAFQVLEHLENYFLIEQEIKRILKPGGYFIFSVPNQMNFFFRLKFALTGNMEGWSQKNNHLLFLTRDVFAKTYLKDFYLLQKHYNKGHVPMLGRLKFIPFLHLKSRTRILPRSEWFSDRVCYVLRKK